MQRLTLDAQGGSTSAVTLEALAHVAISLGEASSIVVGLGAGCSTSAGIPDFRTPRASSLSFPTSPPPSSCTSTRSVQATKHLFSYSALLQPDSRADHLRFMAELRRTVRRAYPRPSSSSSSASAKGKERACDPPTPFHGLLTALDEGGKLQRVYTQNIDGLERRSGLAVVDLGQMAAAEAAEDSGECEHERAASVEGEAERGEGVVVPLHGGLDEVVCGACGWRQRWRKAHTKAFKKGRGVECPRCSERVTSRRERLKRTTSLSPLAFLRPAVLLYDDPHSSASSASDLIASLASSDLAGEPDLLLVAGTSLRIPGFKKLVKRFSARVGRSGGLRVLVNREAVGKEWDGVFDYHFVGDVDDWADDMVDWLDTLAVAVPEPEPEPGSTSPLALVDTPPPSSPFAPLPARPVHGLYSPAPSSSSTSAMLSLSTTPLRPAPVPLHDSTTLAPASAKGSCRWSPSPSPSCSPEPAHEVQPLPTPPPSSVVLAPVPLPPPRPRPRSITAHVQPVAQPTASSDPARPLKRRRLEKRAPSSASSGMGIAELLARAAVREARDKVERRRDKAARRAKRERRRERDERKRREREGRNGGNEAVPA